QRLRQRRVVERRPALENEAAGVAVELDDLARSVTRLRIGNSLPDAELVLLRREGEHIGVRPIDGLGPAGQFDLADRLRVLDELVRGHLEAVEERPPDGLALSVV